MMMLKPLLTPQRTDPPERLNRRAGWRARAVPLALLCSLLLSACQGLPDRLSGLWPLGAAASATPGAAPSASPEAASTARPEPTGTQGPASPEPPASITLWLPPQFDPNSGSTAGNLLKARLASFTQQEGGLEVVVRIKSASGAGGLLEALSAASAAAPAALPDLAALSRADLETAALKGLLQPYETSAGDLDGTDWYPFAREMGMLQGSIFGLPFAGDVQVLLNRPAQAPNPPADWAALFAQPGAVAFPAADPQALLTLALYQAAGGTLADEQGRPALNADQLAAALKLYASGAESGAAPAWLAQYETDGQAWQAYRESRSAWVVTWSSRYLADLPADTALLPLPPLTPGGSLSLATGWAWTLGRPEPLRRAAAARLAVYLTDSSFLSEWDRAAGYLPPRPSALAAWPNQSLQHALNQAALSAQVRPSSDLMAGLGPILRDAALSVIRRESDPAQAAQAASEKLKGPDHVP